MFEKILLAVDGSPHSSKTVPVASDLASRYGSTVKVLHVREHGRHEGTDVDLGPPMDPDELVEGVVATLQAAGVSASGEVRRVSPGSTPEEIVDAAEKDGASLIVMGTRGMTEWRSLLLGGVANKVVHHAGCPVLLVR
jgi:nucleotide-binding universal stress UspA family protein